MSVWTWILSAILFIVSLGILIVIHELGHFSMAKLFKVYCQEFSIGFGPALLHVRKKGKETYFSVRAIPLGGYVSMYGEGVELENGVTLPPERSLDGIKRWKKAIILVAGITLNAILALTLFAVSDICFPTTYISRNVSVSESSSLYGQGLRDGDAMCFVGPSDNLKVVINDKIGDNTYQDVFYILNDDVTIDENKYVLCWSPSTNSSEPKLSNSVHLLSADKEGKIENCEIFKKWKEAGVILANYPDFTKSEYKAYANVSFTAKISFATYLGKDHDPAYDEPKAYEAKFEAEASGDSYIWKDIGISSKLQKIWDPFASRVQKTFTDFGNASVAVIKGVASLFTGGLKNMSGIVGIFTQSASVLSNYTFNTYLYFWGLISVNLAIFNLLPFPGLDGWALLVTAIEGATNAIRRFKYHRRIKLNPPSQVGEEYVEWKIPSKVKNIVSMIGLGLLFLLMIAIVVMDVLRIAGVA